MTLETFFDKFDIFADAPGAVRKMRKLVLQLAGYYWSMLREEEPQTLKTSILGAK